MKASDLTLLVFTCTAREHLLSETWKSWETAICQAGPRKRLVAVDGAFDSSAYRDISPDVVVQSPIRCGYVCSILRALPLIETEFFLWLEDDWLVNGVLDIKGILSFQKEFRFDQGQGPEDRT